MFVLKLGLLTCVFYIFMTVVLETGLWAVAYFRGFGVFITGKHPGLCLGVFFGVIFGAMWLISFVAAWHIVYLDLKSRLPNPLN